MADVSKERLRKEITAILKNADLTKTSAKKVRQQLEEKLKVDLADQKKIVDELVMETLREKKGAGKKGKKGDSEDDEEEDGAEEENGGAAAEEEEDEEEEEDSDKEKKKKKAAKRPPPKKAAKGSDSEEGSEDDDEDEYSPKKKAKASAKKTGKKKKKGSDSDSDEDWAKKKTKKAPGGGGAGGGGAKKGGGGYTKPCTLSPELAKLVGQDTMPRHEVVKKIWAIIKERNLYDPKNKQFAICDNDMLKVFGVKRFRTFGMMKHLKNHFS